MAIKRLDPKAVFKVISTTDDAVDKEKSDLPGYATSLDLSKIVFVEGQVPTFFLVKNIGATDYIAIQERHFQVKPPSKDSEGKEIKATVKVVDQGIMMLKYFEIAVKQIEEGGQVIDISMDQFPPALLQEVGAYAMLHSELGDTIKKN